MLFCRNGENLGVGKHLAPAGHDGVELAVVLQQVYFVDDKKHGDLFLSDLSEILGIFRRVFDDVGDIDEHIGVGQSLLAEGEHALLKLVFGR